MDQDYKILIKNLDLKPHIEGGYFKQTYRSPIIHNNRSLMTIIYYMLTDESCIDHWHMNKSDIAHFHMQGGPIKYLVLHLDGKLQEFTLGKNIYKGEMMQLVVPGNTWKACYLKQGNYALITQTVSPGFQYEDMILAKQGQLQTLFPQNKQLIISLSHSKKVNFDLQEVPNFISDADISGQYRYKLRRIWNDKLPKVLFIMHNPSTANQKDSDNTIEICSKFVKKLKMQGKIYGGIYVGNIIPKICIDDESLIFNMQESKLQLQLNKKKIQDMINECQLHILAYGNIKNKYKIKRYLPNLNWHCLDLNSTGNPRHVLRFSMPQKPLLMTLEQKKNTGIIAQ